MLTIKRILDLLISFILIVVLTPLFVVVSAAIKLGSKGPVFFVQERIGKDRKFFKMLKFRTMVENAETIGTGLCSFENDPRITNIGHILRKTSMDELPQLFNVFWGDMSLVGPRPPVTYELGDVKDFSKELNARFRMKPGITGLAQVSGRNDLEWPEKIKIDNEYIEGFRKTGVFLDFKILLETVVVVFAMANVVEKEK